MREIDREEWLGLSAGESLEKAASAFKGRVLFASSLGKEDQAITALIAKLGLDIPTITIDTGRLFPETYDLIEATEGRYSLRMKILLPDQAELSPLVARHGVNLFRKSVELRKACCNARKVIPLRRELANCDAWICGLRRAQSEHRDSLDAISWDAHFGLWKISPLAAWSDKELDDFMETQGVPASPLHAKGFPSVGCACCTRAVKPGEHIRAGRWWWEDEGKKECGLHLSGGKLVRTGKGGDS